MACIKMDGASRDPAWLPLSHEDVKHLMTGVRGHENVLLGGDVDGGIWTSGQSQALIHDIPTCSELVKTSRHRRRVCGVA